MPYINVNDVYIMDNTGKQVDDAVDYALANSNRNLLDNPFFTVNQRDFTSSTGVNNIYTVDRWKINNGGGTGGTVSVTSQGYIKLTTGSAYVSFRQMFGGNELAGKTVTMSVNDNGTISSHSFTVPTRGSADVRAGTFVFKEGCSCHFFVMNTSSAYGYIFQLSIGQGYSATIRAVKLELGSYSTLANDVPPDYGEELRKCQYYFRRVQGDVYLCSGMIINDSSVVFPFPFVMYKNPNVSTTGVISCVSNGGVLSITAIQSVGRATNAIQVRFTTSGATPYAAALLTPQNGGYIDFSADL